MTDHKQDFALQSRLGRIRDSLKSPEDVEARRARRAMEDHERQVRDLRSRWNAPRRHARALPLRKGPWGEKLALLESRLGSGMLVVLVGNRGAGKTQLAVELMRRATDELRLALFRTAMELLMLIKASYRKDSEESELEVLRAHRKSSLLVIDEIGRRAASEWENNLLFEILNQRYADMTDTILTCNMSPPELIESLGPSIVSRMREGGGIIECNWPSFRTH